MDQFLLWTTVFLTVPDTLRCGEPLKRLHVENISVLSPFAKAYRSRNLYISICTWHMQRSCIPTSECRDERSKAISVNLSTLDVTGPASSHYTRCNCSFVPVRREMLVNGMEYELSLLSERRSRVFYPHIPSGLVSMRRRLTSLCVEMDTQW